MSVAPTHALSINESILWTLRTAVRKEQSKTQTRHCVKRRSFAPHWPRNDGLSSALPWGFQRTGAGLTTAWQTLERENVNSHYDWLFLDLVFQYAKLGTWLMRSGLALHVPSMSEMPGQDTGKLARHRTVELEGLSGGDPRRRCARFSIDKKNRGEWRLLGLVARIPVLTVEAPGHARRELKCADPNHAATMTRPCNDAGSAVIETSGDAIAAVEGESRRELRSRQGA